MNNPPQPPSPPPNIYIVGAQCTGKTTLVNNLYTFFTSHPLNPPAPIPKIITEVARTVLRTHAFTAADVRIPARSLALQRLILQAQAAAERDSLPSPEKEAGWFISDRAGADPIAYALRYVGAAEAAHGLVQSAEWAELKGRMAEGVVVVCEAGEEAAGWLRDDGVRLMPEGVEEWVGFHELFCGFLEGEGVRYTVLPAAVGGHEERVGFVVKRWRERWREMLGVQGGGHVVGEGEREG